MMGLGILRCDGFASMNANEEVGTLVTGPLTYSGRALHLNAEVEENGWVKAGFVAATAICVFVGLNLPVLGDDERPVARGVNSIPDFAGVIGSSKLRPVVSCR